MGSILSTHIKDAKGNKIYDRREINNTITKYYTNLYYSNEKETHQKVLDYKINEEYEVIPEFLEGEVEKIINNLRDNKSPGSDKICNEQIKYGGKELLKVLTNIFNNILITQEIPTLWKKSDIILIYKKGDRHIIDNYRPITISSTMAKIFSKLIEQRLKGILDYQQPCEQAGFRTSFSTIDHLHTINQIIEKTNEYGITLHLVFIDYKKAFDSLEHNFLLAALKNQGVPTALVRLIKNLYSNIEARIITDKEGNYFKISKGVKQGDPLSPLLFNCALEEVFRNINWEGKGVKINGKYLNNLRFADDIVLMSSDIKELELMITDLNREGCKAGLRMNIDKSVIMSPLQTIDIIIGNEKLQQMDDTIYLGQLISLKKQNLKRNKQKNHNRME